MIPVEKYSICSTLNVEYETVEHVHPVTKQSTGGPLYYFNRWDPFFIISTDGPLLYYSNRWGPFFIISTDGPLLYYFNTGAPFFIISTGGGPSLLFQRMGPFFIISTSRAPLFQQIVFLFFQLVHGAPSLLFQRVVPLLYYFKGCTGPCSFVLTFRFLLIVINFRSNYSQIVHFQV